jgi:hypothetical protein
MVILRSSGTIPILVGFIPVEVPEVRLGVSLEVTGGWFGFPQIHRPYDDYEYLYI